MDIHQIRKDFPMLARKMNGKPLVYLDNAASTHKPQAVIDRMSRFLSEEYSNIHRGVYTLSHEATQAVEDARRTCQSFLNARSSSEIIFVRGATEAINLVAASYGRKTLRAGDEVLISEIEHHANIVPWQRLCEEKQLTLKVIPVNDRGELDIDTYQSLLRERTYMVAVTHVSNALGTINPIDEIIKRAHHAGAVVLVDGAQSAPHMKVDVQAMDADFYCFSGHKVYGPTGIGVLYGKQTYLEAMDPYQTGGDMIESVSFEKTTFAKPPAKFEAGTPAIAEILGLAQAIQYLNSVGLDKIEKHEAQLLKLATARLKDMSGVRIVGQAAHKASLVSFVIEGVHPHDVGTVLNEDGIAVRAGHHCAQPTMKRFGVPATTRASFSFYNTADDIEALCSGIRKVMAVFK